MYGERRIRHHITMLVFLLEDIDSFHLVRVFLQGVDAPCDFFLTGGPEINGTGSGLHEPTEQSDWQERYPQSHAEKTEVM
jgi:hypothetical protein